MHLQIFAIYFQNIEKQSHQPTMDQTIMMRLKFQKTMKHTSTNLQGCCDIISKMLHSLQGCTNSIQYLTLMMILCLAC